jgi:hypothetical protein
MNSLADGSRARNLRRLIFVLGVIMVVCSLAALAYAFWPVEALQEQAPLVPTLFAPP